MVTMSPICNASDMQRAEAPVQWQCERAGC